jgi:hypothetical protein
MEKRSTRMMIEDGQKGENTPALPAVLKSHKQTAKEHSAGMLRFLWVLMLFFSIIIGYAIHENKSQAMQTSIAA